MNLGESGDPAVTLLTFMRLSCGMKYLPMMFFLIDDGAEVIL